MIGLGLAAIKDGLAFSGAPDAEKVCCGFVRIPHLDLLLQIEKPPLLCGGLFWRRRRDFLALHFVALGRAAQQSAGLLLARSRFACGSRSGCGFVRIPCLDLLLQIEKTTASVRWFPLAERKGFEPLILFLVYTISNRAP